MYIHPVQIIILLCVMLVLMAGSMVHARRRDKRTQLAVNGDNAEGRQIKQRLEVLERIATDRENTLSREIEALRHR